MLLLLLGIALLVMKYMGFGPVAEWSWLWVFSPFGGAIVWWWWADSSGYTKRRAMKREDDRKQARIDKNREHIGTLDSSKRRK